MSSPNDLELVLLSYILPRQTSKWGSEDVDFNGKVKVLMMCVLVGLCAPVFASNVVTVISVGNCCTDDSSSDTDMGHCYIKHYTKCIESFKKKSPFLSSCRNTKYTVWCGCLTITSICQKFYLIIIIMSFIPYNQDWISNWTKQATAKGITLVRLTIKQLACVIYNIYSFINFSLLMCAQVVVVGRQGNPDVPCSDWICYPFSLFCLWMNYLNLIFSTQ